MAVKSQGSSLYFLAPLGVPGLTEGSLIRIKCFKSFEMQRGQREKIPTTCLDEDVATFLAGIITPGPASYALDVDNSIAGHWETNLLYEAGIAVDWVFGRADGTAPPTTARGVVSLLIASGGSGYTTAPAVVFTGGSGSGAAATAVVENGVVTGFTGLVAGSGYATAPAITFTGGGGTLAAATATLAFRIAPATSRTFDAFSGYVSDFPISAAVGQALSANISIQISGKTTTTRKV